MGVNDEQLKHLRFADDIVLIIDRIYEAKDILRRLYNILKYGLKINFKKTEYLSNLVVSAEITVDGNPIEQSSSYKYLGHQTSQYA